MGSQTLQIRLAAVTLVALASLASLTGSYAQSNWIQEGSLQSGGRYAPAATAAPNGAIFAIGGLDDVGFSNAVEVYRPSLRRWVPGPSLPDPGRHSHAAATGSDGRIYVIGGWGIGPTSSVLRLKPGPGAAWTAAAPLPTARHLLGAAAGPDGRIYAVGGLASNGDILDVLEIYDPAANTWTTGAPMPTPRYDMGMAMGGDGRIYAIGGVGGPEGDVILNVVEAYSPATDSWTTVAPLPTRRSGVRATKSLDGLIYAIGGGTGQPSVYSRRVDVYSPQQNRWHTTPPTQIAHVDGAAATGRHRIYIISGLTTGGGSTAVVESRPSFCATCQ